METGTVTGLAILGSEIGETELIEKILGPTVEYIGESLRNYPKKRVENIGNIFRIAEKRLGKRIEAEGNVSPKVLKFILDEGSFCDDELSSNYFGGLLASSRSEIDLDDRGGSYLHLVNRLSTYAIKFHYIIYNIVHELCIDCGIDASIRVDCRRLYIYVPQSVLYNAFDFSEKEHDIHWLLLSQALNVIVREGLIDTVRYGLGKAEWISKAYCHPEEENIISEPGLVFIPSTPGFELFLWAHGNSNIHTSSFFSTEFESDLNIEFFEGSKRLISTIDS